MQQSTSQLCQEQRINKLVREPKHQKLKNKTLLNMNYEKPHFWIKNCIKNNFLNKWASKFHHAYLCQTIFHWSMPSQDYTNVMTVLVWKDTIVHTTRLNSRSPATSPQLSSISDHWHNYSVSYAAQGHLPPWYPCFPW